jgi:nitroreductase
VPDQPVPVGEDAPLFEVMRTMRAMRRLKPDPVPDELLERLVEAATWAPSGSNAQAYAFVVVTDRAQMARLAELWRRCVRPVPRIGGIAPADDDGRVGLGAAAPSRRLPARSLRRDARGDRALLRDAAPAARRRQVADRADVPGRPGAPGDPDRAHLRPDRGVVDLPRCAEPAAGRAALGLGANITQWHVFLEHEWKSALAIPRDVNMYAVIPVGWPVGRFGPVSRRPASEVIHRDRW